MTGVGSGFRATLIPAHSQGAGALLWSLIRLLVLDSLFETDGVAYSSSSDVRR